MEKIIIFGGSFDPIHNGHLRIARFASLKLNADVIFVPAKSPRWKTLYASSKQRLDMLNIALKKEGSGSYSISTYELDQPGEGISFTIDTIRHFKEIYPNRELFLLIGFDQVNKFHEWKDAEELSHLARVTFVNRPGVELTNDNCTNFNMLPLNYNESGEVSSSDIRELKSADLPFAVLEYIENNELYFVQKLKEYYEPKRLKHAISVANLAYIIARKNHRDELDKCFIAGMLHDIGKKVSTSDQSRIMQSEFKEYYNVMPLFSYHQFVGKYLAEKEFGITDELILDAINYHATGKAHMSPVAKIIYSSDKIDPTRGYDSSKMISACFKDYYRGFINVLKHNKEFLLETHRSIDNKLTNECMDFYIPEKGLFHRKRK